MIVSLLTIVYTVVSSYLLFRQYDSDIDRIGFSYNDVVKEKKYYSIALSLFEHRTVFQLLCDVAIFVCSDSCMTVVSRGNTGFQESLIDVLLFAYLICISYLMGMGFSLHDRALRDKHLCGFYGLNTYRALGNSLLYLNTGHALSGNILMLLVNVSSFVGLQLCFPRERWLIFYSFLFVFFKQPLLILVSAYWRCLLVLAISLVSALNACEFMNTSILPTSEESTTSRFHRELRSLR